MDRALELDLKLRNVHVQEEETVVGMIFAGFRSLAASHPRCTGQNSSQLDRFAMPPFPAHRRQPRPLQLKSLLMNQKQVHTV
jgi:hypothetical protein